MFRRVRLKISEDGIILSLTPSQFELVRRVVIDLLGGTYPAEMVAVLVGNPSTTILELRTRRVDLRANSNIEMLITEADLKLIYGALSFAFLGCTSEEAFHNRYGFYSENVQAVGLAICTALGQAGANLNSS